MAKKKTEKKKPQAPAKSPKGSAGKKSLSKSSKKAPAAKAKKPAPAGSQKAKTIKAKSAPKRAPASTAKKPVSPKPNIKKAAPKAKPAPPAKKPDPPKSVKAAPAKKDAKSGGNPAPKTSGKTAAKAATPAPVTPEKKVYIPDVNRPTGMYGGVLLSESPKPFPKKSPYSPKELAMLKQALLSERTRLRLELASLDGMTFSGTERTNESPGHSVHIAEHASDMQSTETNIAMRALDEERLAQVEEALQRMDDRQHYGLCVACGEKIGIERLIAKPHAHLCMDCRRKYERERRH